MRGGFLAAATALIITIAIFAASCQQQQAAQPQQPRKENVTKAGCGSDSDCGTGGCSGQVCTTAAEAAGIITTCEYRAEYDCLKLTSCGCVEGKCAWKETPELKSCLDAVKSQQQLPPQKQPQ